MKQNIIFLDYDGVINTEQENFKNYFDNPEAIRYLNKLCLEFDFNIVVTSSWRQHPGYKDFLYNSGLDENIKIIGCTDISYQGRAFEIKNYLEDNDDIDLFIIIDDAFIPGELHKHLIQTTYSKGFNRNKYIEAVAKIDLLTMEKNK